MSRTTRQRLALLTISGIEGGTSILDCRTSSDGICTGSRPSAICWSLHGSLSTSMNARVRFRIRHIMRCSSGGHQRPPLWTISRETLLRLCITKTNTYWPDAGAQKNKQKIGNEIYIFRHSRMKPMLMSPSCSAIDE